MVKNNIPKRPTNNRNIKDKLRKKAAARQGEKKICLTMIVKNESKNMVRLLDSIKRIIDMISIVDTGSSDDTKKVILDWGKKNEIPTAVHEEEFKNFAYNRTHSIKIAKETYPDADYYLLSDADFVWQINNNGVFDKVLLVDQKYLVEQYNKALRYWNVRLLSAKLEWECVGVTHEYWKEKKNQTNYTGEVRTTKIRTLLIDDKEDGGCKTDKFVRDEKLLREGLNDEKTPNDLKTRYKFYLAQTLKDIGHHLDSIEWYKKRIEAGGWAEEIYYSKFQIGVNYEQLGWRKKHALELITKKDKTPEDLQFLTVWNTDNLSPSDLHNQSRQYFSDAALNYTSAHEYRKTRVESLYYLCRMYRCLQLNNLALEIALKGKKIKYPDQDTLFIEHACYDYLFDFEISIVAFYVPNFKDIGRQSLSTLLARSDKLPDWLVKILHDNSSHYI